MKVLALDLATTTGWAYGPASSDVKPRTGTFDLRSEHPDLVPGKLAYQLRLLFRDMGPPDFMAIEATLHPSVQKHGSTIQSQERLHGAALGVAGMYNVPRISEYAPSTVRKHFCGQGHAGADGDIKGMVMTRARTLGYKFSDHNAADACALWDYAVFAVLRHVPSSLRMF